MECISYASYITHEFECSKVQTNHVCIRRECEKLYAHAILTMMGACLCQRSYFVFQIRSRRKPLQDSYNVCCDRKFAVESLPRVPSLFQKKIATGELLRINDFKSQKIRPNESDVLENCFTNFLGVQ